MSRFRPALIAALSAAMPLALAGLSLAPLAAQDAQAPDAQSEAGTDPAPQTEGEARLAKLLEGRVAGEPMRCIRPLRSGQMTTIENTAYVYGSGSTIYVQRTRDPDQISENDVLVSVRFNPSQLCRLDQVRTVDRLTGFFSGVVFFEDFVPYTRVKSDSAGGA